MHQPTLWIGLMSGTSADAVDAALVAIGPQPGSLELVERIECPVPESLRKRIHGVSQAPVLVRDLLQLDREIAECFGAAVLDLLDRAGVAAREVEGIGSHGQTVAHYPDEAVRGSLQLGSPSVIHEATGIPVVADFRAADLAAGGQGAPLTPFLHHARFASADETRAVLNIGGFTNVTWLPGEDPADVIAFDPGPGNALLDGAVRAATGGRERYDRDGAGARRGRVCPGALDALLADEYFSLAPPKSTGHEHFDAGFLADARARVVAEGGDDDDLLATLAALTVRSVVDAATRFFPALPERWIVYGGGTRNPVLMDALAARVAPAPVTTSQAFGMPPDAVEAVAFALLGFCAARGLPSNLPAATGARHAVSLGAATPPGAFRVRS